VEWGCEWTNIISSAATIVMLNSYWISQITGLYCLTGYCLLDSLAQNNATTSSLNIIQLACCCRGYSRRWWWFCKVVCFVVRCVVGQVLAGESWTRKLTRDLCIVCTLPYLHFLSVCSVDLCQIRNEEYDKKLFLQRRTIVLCRLGCFCVLSDYQCKY